MQSPTVCHAPCVQVRVAWVSPPGNWWPGRQWTLQVLGRREWEEWSWEEGSGRRGVGGWKWEEGSGRRGMGGKEWEEGSGRRGRWREDLSLPLQKTRALRGAGGFSRQGDPFST